MSKIKLLLDVVSDMRSLADSIQAVADAMAENKPTTPVATEAPVEKPTKPKAEEPKLRIEDVRAVLVKKKGSEVKELLRKYGHEKLSEIDTADYKSLLADAEVLTNAK